MICAKCGNRSTTSERCSECGEEPRLAERYRLNEVLGQRGAGTTYLAKDGADEVVVKEMLLRRSSDMKEVELFEREAEVLAALDVEGVPHHQEHFEVSRGKTVGLYNVHTYVDGMSLEDELAARRLTTEEVLEATADVLEILAQLREHDPPVVHRDIKPANLIRRAEDGGISLVDFGVARAVAESLHFAGSTVTGTFGYMAPEQLYGHAEPATDVYAVGATAIRMFTGREPHEMLDDDRRFRWHSEAQVADEIVGVIDGMTAWEPEHRPTDLAALAADLRAWCDGESGRLERYAASRALTTTRGRGAIARPPMRGALQELGREPEFRHGMFAGAAVLVVGVFLILGTAAISVTAKGVLLAVYSALVVISPFTSSDFREAIFRLWRYRSGSIVRGIVTDRNNDGKRFRVEYRYEVNGESYTADHAVSADWYFEVEEGDEAYVFFDPKRPERSAFRPLG